MKKEYIKPFSKVAIFSEEEFCESIGVSSPGGTEADDLYGMGTKERGNVDFSKEDDNFFGW